MEVILRVVGCEHTTQLDLDCVPCDGTAEGVELFGVTGVVKFMFTAVISSVA